MAQVPYSEGVPSVSPDARPPDDYIRVQTNPEQFGGGIARSAQQLDAGASKAASFFGEVQTDDSLNGALTKANDAMAKFRSLNGQDALNAQEGTKKAIDDAFKEARDGLSTPEQQHRFDEVSRTYQQRYFAGLLTSHADRAAKQFASSTNKNSLQTALTGVTNVADDDAKVELFRHDARAAVVRQLQIEGNENDPASVNNAIRQADAAVYKTQAEVIGAHDPSRAAALIEKHKDVFGPEYPQLVAGFRERATRQSGENIGKEVYKETYDTVPHESTMMPVLDNIGHQYGISGSYLAKTWQIEASGKFNPPNSSTGAAGPMQFTRTTAARYGVNPNDWQSSMDGAARLAADNKAAMSQLIGRPPTDAELYLAHQQGAQGASLLLSNPNVRAGDLLPPRMVKGKLVDPIKDNGGDPNAPASAFTSMWTSKFNGAPVAYSNSRRADAYQRIVSDPNLSEGERRYALQYVDRAARMQTIAMEEDAQNRKLVNESAANEYVTQMLTGQPFDMNAMANDPRLDHTTKENLSQFASVKLGLEDPIQFGAKYTDTYARIFAKADDPSKITDINQILQMGMPGGGLTPRGVDRLTKIFSESRNAKLQQNDANAIGTSKASLLKYAQSVMGREQIIAGLGPLTTNKKGMEKFNAEFVPRFEAEYDKWVKSDKNPYDFLNKKHIDDLMDQIYPKSQRDADSIQGMSNLPQKQPEKNTPLPAAPSGVSDHDAWADVVSHPPLTQAGERMNPQMWSEAIQTLLNDPTPKVAAAFDRHFGTAGYRAADILGRIGNKPAAPPASPNVAPQSNAEPQAQPTASSPGAYFGGQIKPPSEDEIKRADAEAEADRQRRAQASEEERKSDVAALSKTRESLASLASPEGRKRIEEVSQEREKNQRIASLASEEANLKDHLERLSREERTGLHVAERRREIEARMKEIERERHSLNK